MTNAPKLTHPAHPLSEIFPMMSGKPLWELRDDIAKNGLIDEIVLLDEMTLEGRNRDICCTMSGSAHRFRQFGSLKSDGKDPLAFVISKNLKRRHLGEAERALVAARISNLQRGYKSNPSGGGLSQSEAAEKLNVSEKAVERASKVEKNGDPELIKAVQDKTITLSDAAAVAKESPKVQREAVKAVESGKARTVRQAVEKKAGKVVFDDRKFETLFGALVRFVDSRAKAYGKHAEYTNICTYLEAIIPAYKRWMKATT